MKLLDLYNEIKINKPALNYEEFKNWLNELEEFFYPEEFGEDEENEELDELYNEVQDIINIYIDYDLGYDNLDGYKDKLSYKDIQELYKELLPIYNKLKK